VALLDGLDADGGDAIGADRQCAAAEMGVDLHADGARSALMGIAGASGTLRIVSFVVSQRIGRSAN